jgi:hypothetical protein
VCTKEAFSQLQFQYKQLILQVFIQISSYHHLVAENEEAIYGLFREVLIANLEAATQEQYCKLDLTSPG